jgi:hypothetical protein
MHIYIDEIKERNTSVQDLICCNAAFFFSLFEMRGGMLLCFDQQHSHTEYALYFSRVRERERERY